MEMSFPKPYGGSEAKLAINCVNSEYFGALQPSLTTIGARLTMRETNQDWLQNPTSVTSQATSNKWYIMTTSEQQNRDQQTPGGVQGLFTGFRAGMSVAEQDQQTPATPSSGSRTQSLRPIFQAFVAGALLAFGLTRLGADMFDATVDIPLSVIGILWAVHLQKKG